MRSYYSIFGCVNMICDDAGGKRGMRKRDSVTKLFVVSGTIQLQSGGELYTVGTGEEFHVSAGQWHGWTCVTDAKVLQMLPDYNDLTEERKEFGCAELS